MGGHDRRPGGRPDGGLAGQRRAHPPALHHGQPAGRRFTNEAANYNALGAAFHVIDVSSFDYINHPAWMIFDRHYLTRYGLAGYRGEGDTPDWMT